MANAAGMAPRISSFCFGEACAGVWSRQGSDASLVLETVFLFVVLWLALTTLAVVREMAWRRGREAVTDKTTNAPLRRLVRQIGLLNERCPARTLHDTRGRAEQCAICLDALDASVPVRELPCAHRFHIGYVFRRGYTRAELNADARRIGVLTGGCCRR